MSGPKSFCDESQDAAGWSVNVEDLVARLTDDPERTGAATLPSEKEIRSALNALSGDSQLQRRTTLLKAVRARHPDLLHFGVQLLMALKKQESPEVCGLAKELSNQPHGDEAQCAYIAQTLAEASENEASLSYLEGAAAKHPNSVTLRHNLGLGLYTLKRLPEALDAFRRAIELCPYSETSLTMAGTVLRDLGRLSEAIEFHGAAIRVNSKSYLALYNLGNALQEQGEFDAATEAYYQALAIRPDSTDLLNNLGVVLARTARYQAALPVLLRLTKLRNNLPEDLSRTAVVLRELNRLPEGLEIIEILIKQFPENPLYRTLKGGFLSLMGRSEEAALEYEKIIARHPGNLAAHKALVYVANYLPYKDPRDLFKFYQKFGQLVEDHFKDARYQPQPTAPFPRKLRIGYVSGDFCQHPVGTFIKPILSHHDQSAFEIFCYYNYARTDWITKILRAQPVHWREIEQLSDKAFCEKIREDHIDILVDLSGHTTRNRLGAFALKPAPLQVTMIGCMQTTGLTAMDYRVTDAILDPPGQTEELHTEKLIRLESGPLCFEAHPDAPEPAGVPSLAGAPFTFGSYNNMAKVTPSVLALWSKILLASPKARMQVVCDSAEVFLRDMETRGVPRSRFTILPRMNEAEYLASHSAVDLILDTFPYCGLTVTMNALWMGVPNVTLEGNTSASRAGASVLKRLGLDGFITANAKEYMQTALRYANDPQSLSELRSTLRGRMRTVWADGARHTRELEDQFRHIWQTHSGEVPCAPASLPQTAPTLTPTPPTSHEVPRPLKSDAAQISTPEAALATEIREISEAPNPQQGLEKTIASLKDAPDATRRLEKEESRITNSPLSWKNLAICGELFAAMGARADAERCFGKCSHQPASSAEWAWLARSYDRAGFPDQAEAAFITASEFPEASPDATLGLSLIFAKSGRNAEAELYARRTIGLRPSLWEAYLNLGNILYQRGNFEEARRVTEPATRISDNPALLLNLAAYQQKCGAFADSLVSLEKVIEKDPFSAAAYLNLGNSFLFLGMSAEASAAYKKAVDFQPLDANCLSNYLHCQNYLPQSDPEAVFASHRQFSQKFEAPLLPHKPQTNSKDPKRRLRIGYVSPDFRTHSVAYFIEPLLRHHDRSQFEVVGFLSHTWKDKKTDHLRSLCDRWVDAGVLDDADLAERMRAEGIDIAVDLVCHSQGMRLLTFARKPAPIQVTMIGMQQTTGLDSMDYRVTDATMDPPGTSERFHSETLMRLPLAFCLQPPDPSPPVVPLPALEKGMITFGSFNNFAKIHIGVLRTWAKILKQVPNSRFFIVAPEGTSLEQTMAEEGIAPERIIVCPRKSEDAYLRSHDELDLMLDSFPFGGLTVSGIAAWMGVPTLTISGTTPSSRAGADLMHAMDLEDFIASDTEDFVKKAVAIASDLPKLSAIRASMRERMAVQVTNGGAYARSFESELRKAWERWCESP
ncbi:MAG: SPINDLY family [Verrucomicrobia bacterium]|nr:MAG: SPINDLY family [Verrucomicrobiota bacterium]